MLFGDRVKFVTLVVGITFAVLLITQQGSIFSGLMLRTCSEIFETNMPIWVADPRVQSSSDNIPLRETLLQEVKSVDGVEWAVPFLFNTVQAQSDDGKTAIVSLVGVDNESLIGIPNQMKEGTLTALNDPEGVIVSSQRRERYGSPGVGDYFELNNKRAKVVGILESGVGFTPFPKIYTTYSKALWFLPPREKYLSFILVKPKHLSETKAVMQRIREKTGLEAYDQYDFAWKTMGYWAKNTGIPINFGTTVILGVLVGAAISAQTLYTFMIENIRQFGTFKAIGISTPVLVGMVLLQSLTVGFIGYGIGLGLMAIFGSLIPANGQLAFYTHPYLLLIALAVVMIFCVLASLLSIRRVITIEPGIVFRG